MPDLSSIESQPVDTSDELGGDEFCRRWRVIAGSMRHPCADPMADTATESTAEPSREIAVIESNGDGTYALCSFVDGDCKSLQTLEYKPLTRTLENLPGDRPRCLFMWRDAMPRCIVGIRRVNAHRPMASHDAELLPWEDETDDGTWGAEEEPLNSPGAG
ncbi:MAG: hypothetical protein AAGE94_16540 [Acidobacteriota bacterium]